MSSFKRTLALDIAAALAGGAFFAVTSFFMLGAVVWAALSAIRAPMPAIGAGEALAALAAVVIGVLVARNAIRLAADEAP